MTALMHLGILRAAAFLVPARQRAEWLSEWRTELWYACRDGGTNLTSFCLGAFPDALWLRRNAPLPRCYGSLLIEVRQNFPDLPPAGDSRFLDSPVRCLALLALLAAVQLAIAFLLPTARHIIFETQPDARSQATFLNLLTLFAVAWLIVPATTSLSLGDYPANCAGLRRWGFFVAKIALILPIVTLGALNLASIGRSISPMWIHSTLWSTVMALRWALLDQRRRCPVCLRLLANPVRIGQASRRLLEWNGTELMCPRGHGLLHVPEISPIWFSKQRWLCLDASWSGLFLPAYRSLTVAAQRRASHNTRTEPRL